jgi:hypothetical protein
LSCLFSAACRLLSPRQRPRHGFQGRVWSCETGGAAESELGWAHGP